MNRTGKAVVERFRAEPIQRGLKKRKREAINTAQMRELRGGKGKVPILQGTAREWGAFKNGHRMITKQNSKVGTRRNPKKHKASRRRGLEKL